MDDIEQVSSQKFSTFRSSFVASKNKFCLALESCYGENAKWSCFDEVFFHFRIMLIQEY